MGAILRIDVNPSLCQRLVILPSGIKLEPLKVLISIKLYKHVEPRGEGMAVSQLTALNHWGEDQCTKRPRSS